MRHLFSGSFRKPIKSLVARLTNRGAILSLLLLLLPMPAMGASGDLDLAFDPNANGQVLSIAVQPDAKMLIGGIFSMVGASARSNLARLNADGTVDAGFNPSVLGGAVRAIVVLPDGKALVGGGFSTIGGVQRNNLARLNANGTVDMTFNPNVDHNVECLAVQPDGKILVGGLFLNVGGVPRNRIARLNADGTLDTTFNSNPDATVWCVAVQADGKILIGGLFNSVNDEPRSYFARLNVDGTLDTAFNVTVTHFVRCTAVQADGKILLGGYFFSVGPTGEHPRLARLNPDGTVDETFDIEISRLFGDYVASIAVQTNGQILVGGLFGTVNGQPQSNHMVRLHANGTLDTTYNPNVNSVRTVYGVAVQADGRALGVGDFTQVNGVTRNRIARFQETIAPTQSLTVPNATRVQWLRGATAPETLQVTFELSTDAGANYSVLGGGTRIAGGWELTGLVLPASGQIRARARTTGGSGSGSGGLVEAVAAFSGLAVPEIAVTGNGANIADGDATPSVADFTDFGGVATAAGSVVRAFTISNSGTATLNVGTVTVGGAHAADFTVTTAPAATVAVGGNTTFQVTFNPSVTGVRTATLSFSTNDANENPFNFSIQGTGLNSAPTDIALSASSIAENNAAGATVGTLSATDADPGSTFTYTLVAGTGSTDNNSFTIAGTALKLTPSADFETKSSYALRVNVSDGAANFAKAFTVTITNVNEVPSFTKGASVSLPGGTTSAQTMAGWATAISDGDSTVTQALTFNVSNNNPAIFTAPPAIASNGTLTFTPNGTAGSATVSVSLTDDNTINGNAALTSAVQTFTIFVAIPPPEISVEQPAGTAVADGGSRNFGSVGLGTSAPLTFTIRNTGGSPLDLTGAPVLSGPHAADFVVTSPPSPPSPGGLTVGNPSFETPAHAAGAWSYNPAGTGWSFGTSTGTARNGSPWYVNAAPDGLQAAFIQSNGANAQFSRSVNFPAAGEYTIRFFIVRRSASLPGNDVDVKIDGITLGTITTAQQPDDVWRAFTVPYVCTSPGNHTLSFAGTRAGINNCSAIDSVQIIQASKFLVTFAPTAPGARSATLSIPNNDLDENPYDIVLTGTGLGPEMSITEGATEIAAGGTRDFGSADAAAPRALTFAIRNTGAGELLLAGTPKVAIGGAQAADFTVTVQPGSSVLGNGDAVDLDGSFELPSLNAPVWGYQFSGVGWVAGTSGGLATNGGPWFANPAPQGTQATFVQSGGEGAFVSRVIHFPSAGQYGIRFSMVRRAGGEANDIEVQMDGTVLRAIGHLEQPDDTWRTFTVPYICTAPGNHTLAFVGTRVGDAFGSAIDDVRILGASTFQITFAPTGGGPRTAILSIASNDSDESPYEITLTGTGPTPEMAVAGGGVEIADGGTRDFGSVNSGSPHPLAFTIRNTGGDALLLTNTPQVTISGAQAADFTVTAPPASSIPAAILPSNRGFETPALAPGAWNYALAGVDWIAGSTAGVASNGSPWFVNPAPEGTHAAFVQFNGAGASLSRTVHFPSAGQYEIWFSVVRRGGGYAGNDIEVKMDGTTIGAISNTAQPDDVWRTFSVPYTCAVSGDHTLAFVGTRGGDDYASAIDDVRIFATSTFEVTFTPTAAGSRTATLSIASNDVDESPYDITLTGTGLVALTALENWRQLHFGTAANAGNAADLFDFDRDGLVNLLEFAFGQNPTDPGSLQVPAVQRSGGNLFYSFTTPAGVSGITYAAEWSTTFPAETWTPVADTGVAPQHVFSVPTQGRDQLYLRLKISAP